MTNAKDTLQASPLIDATRHAAIVQLARQSIDVIAANQHVSGAYPASPNFEVYRYCWFRDGSFIADAMSRVGEPASADAFFAWCGRVLAGRAGQITSVVSRQVSGDDPSDDELLPCRYTLEGDDAAEPWWDFQLDGYGAWLWALAGHAGRHATDLALHTEAVRLTIDYLCAFWDRPCYDWWEENPGRRHLSTLGAIYGGLTAALSVGLLDDGRRDRVSETANAIRDLVLLDAVREGRLAKWIGGSELDASLVSCMTPFGLVGAMDPIAVATIEGIEAELANGGVHRYATDSYFGGGEWPLLTALLGWHCAETGRTPEAVERLLWVAAQADPGGNLPEQTAAHLLSPEREPEWIERWGTSASPLLWSHAMFLTLAGALGLLGEDQP